MCLEKKRLIDELSVVIRSILALHSREAQALIDGDYSTHPALNEQLRTDQVRRASLLAELKEHTAGHGC